MTTPITGDDLLFDSIPVGVALLTTTGMILRPNQRLCDMLGRCAADIAGKPFSAFRHPADAVAIDALAARADAAGDSDFAFDARLLRNDGALLLAGINCRLRRASDGAPRIITAVFRDITEQKALQDHQKLLIHELSHRTKNLLAVIQGLARQMTAYATSAEDFERRFAPRLAGLAASHDLLVEGDWQGADLSQMIARHLRPFVAPDGERLRIYGPPVTIRSVSVQHLGMALYELAANAATHGALSGSQGVVTVAWKIAGERDDPTFEIAWTERGGPPARAPQSGGFGQIVTEQMLGYALNGDVAVAFEPEGYRWALTAPLANVGELRTPVAAGA